MPLSFEQVKQAHQLASQEDPSFGQMDLGSFAKFMNQATGTEEYQAGDVGMVGRAVKEYSTGFDKLLAPVSNVMGKGGRAVGEMIGFPDVLEQVGESLPRTGLEFGATALGSGVGGPVGQIVAAGGAASAGAKAYTDTGSPLVGGITAAATRLVPGAANMGINLAAKHITKEMASKGVAPLAQRAVEYGAAQVGAQVPIEVGNQLSSVVQGQGLQNPFTKENVVANIAGALAFAPFDVPMLAKGYKNTSQGPVAPTFVDLAKGTETPIASRGDWLNVEEAKRAVTDLQTSLEEVVEPLQATVNEAETLKKTESTFVDPDPPKIQPKVKQGPETEIEQLANKPVSLRPLEDLANEAYVYFKAGAPVSPDTISKKVNIPFSQATQVMGVLEKKGLITPQLAGGRRKLTADLVGKVPDIQPFGWRVARLANTPEGKRKMPVQQLIGQIRNQFPAEWEMLRLSGLEEYLNKKGDGSLEEVKEWAERFAPKVEVKELLADEGAKGNRRAEELQHWYETLDVDTQEAVDMVVRGMSLEEAREVAPTLTQEQVNMALETANLPEDAYGKLGGKNESATARYTMVNPKPLDQMEGAVDLLVRIPLNENANVLQGESKGLKYTSSHYPTEGKNLLAHVRGYFETFQGKKVFHVFETQSDWAQAAQKENKQLKAAGLGGVPISQVNRGLSMTQGDPLLNHYERLALKAAIDHAVKNGADYIAISDAETAMLTEGHDRGGIQETADRERGVITQEKGMRLHYDQTLPKIAKELTGREGLVVEFGEHQNALEARTALYNELGQSTQGDRYRKDLIFKNPDGTPKTSITARLFPLDQAKAKLAEIGEFSLLGRQDMSIKPPLETKESDSYLSDVLNKLSDLGATDEQLAKVVQLAKNAGGKRDVDIAREAAKRIVLEEAGQALGHPEFQRPDNMATVKGVTAFFKSLYEQRGYSTEGIDRLANIATKMAVALGQFDVRVVRGADNDVNFFIPLTDSPDGKMVVLAQNRSFELTARDMAHTLWVLGHELTHAWAQDVKIGAGDPRANKIYADAYATFKEYTPQELNDVFTTLHASIFPKVTVSTKSLKGVGEVDLQAIEMMYERRGKTYSDGETGVREFMGDVVGLLAMGAASPGKQKSFANMLELLRFSEPRVQDFMFQMFTDIGAVVQGNEALLDVLWKGDEAQRRKMGQPISTALSNISQLMHERLAADMAKQYLDVLASNLERTPYSEGISYDQIKKVYAAADLLMWKGYDKGVPETQNFPDFKQLVKQGYEMMFEPGTWEKRSGLRLGLLDYIKPMGQLVKDFPIMGSVFDLGTGFQNHATELAKKLWEPFFGMEKGEDGKMRGTGKLDEEFIRKLTDPKSPIQRPLSKILLAQNEVQRFLTEEEFKEYAGHLSEENQALLRRGISAISQTSVRAAIARYAAEVSKIKSTIATKLVHKLQGGQKVDVKGSKVLAEQVYEYMFEGKPVSLAVQQLPVELLAQLTDFSNGLKPKMKELQVKLLGEDGAGKPWWTTEVRLGEYFIGWREGKRPFVKGFFTKKEAVEYGTKLRQRGIQPKEWDKRDRQNFAQGFDPDLLQRYAEMDKIQYEKVLTALELSDEEKKFAQELFMPGEGAWRLITPPSMQERNLLGGRDDLNMMAGMMHYIDSTALGLAKQFIRSEAAIRLHTPEMRANTNIQNAARQYLNNIITPGGKEFHALKSFVFFQYMGLSPATWFTEPTQLAVAHVPYLVREGAGIQEAYKLTAKAMSKAAKYAINPEQFSKEDPMVAKALVQAANEGVVDQGFVQEVAMTEDVNTINLRNLSRGNDLINSLELAKKPGYWLMKLARQFYSVPAHLVTRSAFLSSFEYALSRGSGYDEAYSFAKDAVRSTAYTGGTAARPLVFSYMGKAQGIGGLMYTLSSYTFNTIAYMARTAKEAIGKSGLSDAERMQARKAAGLMLGTQVALGGALGLPFAATAIALIEQLFPEAEVRKNLRETMAGLAGQDEEMGGMMADAALHGVLNLGPVDVGSRFQLGAVFGLNPFDGFAWQNVFGPAANIATNWTRAVGDLSKGEVASAARRVTPTGLRGFVDLATNNWQVKDRLGNLVFDPTAAETATRLLGFSPKRLSQYYEQQSILKRSEQIAGDKLNRFHRNLAERLLEGDTLGVRRDLVQMQSELAGYDARAGARRVAELVQNMTEPADLYRQGRRVGINDRASLAATYSQVPQKPEVVRLQERKQVERALGIPGVGRVSKQELTLATMIDRLRQTNPSLTYQQAKQMVLVSLGQSQPVPLQ
jgi:hypothetical protein